MASLLVGDGRRAAAWAMARVAGPDQWRGAAGCPALTCATTGARGAERGNALCQCVGCRRLDATLQRSQVPSDGTVGNGTGASGREPARHDPRHATSWRPSGHWPTAWRQTASSWRHAPTNRLSNLVRLRPVSRALPRPRAARPEAHARAIWLASCVRFLTKAPRSCIR